MAEESKPPIIVKRIKKGGGGHHGGAWKIAYADFVTAMMAFFLLMWLLGSTSQGDLKGISEYFATPLKVALAGGSGSGDSTSVIQGGGTDLTRKDGQVKKGPRSDEKTPMSLQAAKAELERQERDRLAELKSRLDKAIDANAALKPYKDQLRVDMTPDGLRIQIVDEQNRAMFDSGSAQLKDYTRKILQELGKLMNDVPNRIQLSGHTDAKQYAAGERGYSNWELSADRANASRRELVAGGIDENKMIRVVGLGSSVMIDKNDPNNPINRRISITVLNKAAEERILSDGVLAKDASEGVAAIEGSSAKPEAPKGSPTTVPTTAPAAAPQGTTSKAPADVSPASAAATAHAAAQAAARAAAVATTHSK